MLATSDKVRNLSAGMIWRALTLPMLALVLASAADAREKRVALVIGNSDYLYAPALANPRNDAEAMTLALKRLDYEVIEGTDLDYAGMQTTLAQFTDTLQGADSALFYYAGHGVQANGRNYLIPVDAKLSRWSDLRFRAVDIEVFLDEMRETNVDILLLDACRDNPFDLTTDRSSAGRSLSPTRGLAEITEPRGSFIAFATDPGNIALDGVGYHSPFTEALLRHIETPGLEIGAMMARVRADVLQTTNGKQHPWSSSSLVGEYFLSPAEEKPVLTAELTPPTAAPQQSDQAGGVEIEFWRSVRELDTAASYKAYLGAYSDGYFAPLARLRLQQLPLAKAADEVAQDIPKTTETVRQTQVEDIKSAALPTKTETPAPATESAPGPDEEVDPSSAAQALEQSLALSRRDRRQIQRRLTLIGFDTRGVDGVLGANSREALARWQQSRDLPDTGYLDQASLKILEEDSDQALASWNRDQASKAAARKTAAKEAARKRAAAAAARAEETARTEQAARELEAARRAEADREQEAARTAAARRAEAAREPAKAEPQPKKPSLAEQHRDEFLEVIGGSGDGW